MTEVETATALVRRAAGGHDAVLKAQARVWSSDVLLSVTTRLLKLFSASDLVSSRALQDLRAAADAADPLEAQRGRLADMDFIAAAITGRDA